MFFLPLGVPSMILTNNNKMIFLLLEEKEEEDKLLKTVLKKKQKVDNLFMHRKIEGYFKVLINRHLL